MLTIDEIYNKYYYALSENEKYIFNYIITHLNSVKDIAITDLAVVLSVSNSTITRFAQKIGFKGFTQLKYYINEVSKIAPQADSRRSVEIVMDDLSATYKLFKRVAIDEIITEMQTADNIFLYGTGWGQKNALNDLRRNLILCDKYTIDIPEETELHIMATNAGETDLLIIISLSGNVQDIENDLHLIKAKGGKILAITGIQANLLAKLADYVIYYQTTGVSYKRYDMVSFIPVYQAVNLLFLEYFERIREKDPNFKGAPYYEKIQPTRH